MNEKTTMNAREINTAARNIVDRLDDERAKQHDTIMNYREEVEHLKSQLRALKEKGEQLLMFAKHIEPSRSDNEIIDTTRLISDRQCAGERGVKYLMVVGIRGLAAELEKVEDE